MRRRVPPRMPAFAALALIATTIAVAPLPAQKGDTPTTLWLVGAGLHTPGALDNPVRAVSQWSHTHGVTTVTLGLRSKPPTAILIKALVLHTDAAIAERNAVEAGHRQGRPGSAVVLDGQSLGRAPRSLQWELGRLIAEHLATRRIGVGIDGQTPDPAITDGVPAARAWYRASSAVLQHWVDCGTLERHLDEALRVFPADATLLMYRGTLHQTLADARVQVWVRAGASAAGRRLFIPDMPRVPRDNEDNLPATNPDATGVSPNTPASPMNIATRSKELEVAERDLRRALAIEPGLVEARIRLAHVLGDKGEPQEAAALARAAAEQPLPPFLDYYAAIVLGRAEEALDRRAEARTAFERAAQRFPYAQSARVALSRVALIERRPADGVAALVALKTAVVPRDREDPWWWYFRTHDPGWQAQIAELRRLAR